nr:MAG TPA: hypothetical protein [Caudoviricetes sp.]
MVYIHNLYLKCFVNAKIYIIFNNVYIKVKI